MAIDKKDRMHGVGLVAIADSSNYHRPSSMQVTWGRRTRNLVRVPDPGQVRQSPVKAIAQPPGLQAGPTAWIVRDGLAFDPGQVLADGGAGYK